MNTQFYDNIILGGILGLSKIISNQLCLNDHGIIIDQILDSDNIKIKGLENFDVMRLSDVVRAIAFKVLHSDEDFDYFNESLQGEIMLFSEGNTNLEKCLVFIGESNLEIEEKRTLVEAIEDNLFEFSAITILEEVFADDSLKFNEFISFIKDYSVEKEYRLSNLQKIILKLREAIDKNEELIKSNTLGHLKLCAKIANDKYQNFLDLIEQELSNYTINLKITRITSNKKNIINSLINKSQETTFLDYENKIVSYGFLSEDRNKWKKKSADLIRFYNYCERKNIINRAYEKNSKGIKLMRKLYDYHKNTGSDSPRSKRLKQDKGHIGQFNFLDII